MNPYESLPQKAFWKPAVANRSMFDIDEIWDPKFKIKQSDKIVTYGSCFAQHIGRALESRGFQWHKPEVAPMGMGAVNAKKFNYGIFSTRTGNIYTTSLLRQWAEWALKDVSPPDEVWGKDGRYIDPFRPRVEPTGFASVEELTKSRAATINAFKAGVKDASFFVFTLGLTESWFNGTDGYEYPMCPGTVAGEFDENVHQFKNQQFNDVITNLVEAIELMRSVNPTLRFLLTVSPVPLTATMSSRHVAVATMASKSVLRAVAEQLASNRDYVDYFPSYEIINSPIFRGAFFEPNQRDVNPAGVNFVMNNFFQCQTGKFGALALTGVAHETAADTTDVVCEEALLEAFQNA
jgi:hypothetical protein